MALELMSKEDKQRVFPVLLYNRGGDVAQTCNDIGISRYMWRKWIDEDEEFAQSCIDAGESLLDMAEGKLIENVRKGMSKDIQFLLKTKGRARGYGEKVEVEHTGTIAHAHGIRYYPPEPVSIEDWEKQVEQAEQAHKLAQNTDDKASDQDVGSTLALEAPGTLDTLDTLDTFDAGEPVKASVPINLLTLSTD